MRRSPLPGTGANRLIYCSGWYAARRNHMAKKKNKSASTRRSADTAARKLKKEMIALRATVAAIVVFALCVLGYRLVQSDWYLQHTTAMTVNGYKLTVTDYNFYFYRSYYEYLNHVDDSITGIGGTPDEKQPLSEQLLYDQPGETVTWLDYFNSRAETLLRPGAEKRF